MSKKSGNSKKELEKLDQAGVYVQKGRTRPSWASYEFTIFTKEATLTITKAIKPSMFAYREAVGMLSHSGFGQVIGQVNQLVGHRIQAAINVAKNTEGEMEKAIALLEERMDVKVVRRDLGEGNHAKIVCSSEIGKKMTELARATDRAVIACDMARIADAVPYQKAHEAIGAVIAHNRLMRKSVEKMHECIQAKVGGQKIDIKDLIAGITEDWKSAVAETKIAKQVANKRGSAKTSGGNDTEAQAEAEDQMPSSLRKALQGAKS